MKVLIVEDDAEAAAYLSRGLTEAGHSADIAGDGEMGSELATGNDYDVLIIDRMLPKKDGLTLINELRNTGKQVPILVLSALSQVDDRVKGLRAGGDDYLTKPYAFTELLARVEALGRRKQTAEFEAIYRVGDLVLDRLSHTVTRNDEKVLLQPREFRLLEYLMRHAGQVVTRTMLLEQVWDMSFDPTTSVVETHISRLRAK
ncbi:MAG: response regulator transcription factor, partial [Pseudomonadota bacterium]